MEKIDVHHAREQYAKGLARLEADTTMCAKNKHYVLSYLRDASLGKTILGRQHKRINDKRLVKAITMLRQLNEWLGNKDFTTVTQQEMEDFISRLDANRYLRRDKKGPYATASRHDFKVHLRKFYKWLLGENRQYPPLVSWIDTSFTAPLPPAVSLEDIARCADLTMSVRGRAILWTLFETGARVEEFLNIRVCHVEDKGDHLSVRIEFSKTFRRTLPVFEGAQYLRAWLKSHPDKDNPAAQLFPLSYGALHIFLRRAGTSTIGKPLRPHLLRHSFATWLATKRVGRYQMCKLMGWTMASNMPDRYIDRTGLVEEDAIHAIRTDDLGKVEQENAQLKTSLARLEAQSAAMQERLAKRETTDQLLARLLEDKEIKAVLASRLRKSPLRDELLSL